MRKTMRISAAAAALALSACSGTELVDSTAGVTAPDVTATTIPASTTLSPSSTTSTTTSTTEPATTTVPTRTEILEVPTLPPPEIDGILSQNEWSGAATFEMSDGATVALLADDGTLYVGVGGSKVGAVNVVLGDGETVWILHSSAALGSALYEAGTEHWALSHGFSWCCRDRTDVSTRLELLAQEGWQANIGHTGDAGVIEYQIAMPWQGSSIAVSSIRDSNDTGFWPADLSDNARSQLLGPPPPARAFNITEWQLLAGS